MEKCFRLILALYQLSRWKGVLTRLEPFFGQIGCNMEGVFESQNQNKNESFFVCLVLQAKKQRKMLQIDLGIVPTFTMEGGFDALGTFF